jgi:hypothetical protein
MVKSYANVVAEAVDDIAALKSEKEMQRMRQEKKRRG